MHTSVRWKIWNRALVSIGEYLCAQHPQSVAEHYTTILDHPFSPFPTHVDMFHHAWPGQRWNVMKARAFSNMLDTAWPAIVRAWQGSLFSNTLSLNSRWAGCQWPLRQIHRCILWSFLGVCWSQQFLASGFKEFLISIPTWCDCRPYSPIFGAEFPNPPVWWFVANKTL